MKQSVRHQADFISELATITIESARAYNSPRALAGSISEIRTNLLQPFLEFREMRSGPINLVTANATPELFVVGFRKRFEPLDYFGLGNVAQRRVAANATCKRSNGVKKIKTADYFHGLFVRVL